MVRAVLQDGLIRPLAPLPADWHDGQALVIDIDSMPTSTEEISAWAREIEEAAQEIPDEDHARFLESLAEQRRASKELVRRQMGLA